MDIEENISDENVNKIYILDTVREINNLIIDNNRRLEDTIIDEETNKLLEKNKELEKKKNDLKEKICDEAIEKSGVDFDGKKIKPSEAVKKYNDKIAKLKKEKQELRLQKIGKKALIEEKKAQMNEQFNIAVEKYKGMLEAKKITQELFDSRIANMKAAKEQDISGLDKSLDEFDDRIKEKNSEIEKTNIKLAEAMEKESIYDEYKKAYDEIYGEDLDSIYMNFGNDKIENGEKEEKTTTNEKPNPGTSNNSNYQPIAKGENKENADKEDDLKIVVTSKSKFNELYKKLSSGVITNNELNALTDVLKDEKNYDKYGITTGLIFNKAKKILKAQGNRNFVNIENFLKEASMFSDDIKFDSSIEQDNILSHEVLNSWKDIDDNMVLSNSVFSVEEYIKKIEDYKNSGNELTSKQEKIFQKAMSIKENITNYREAINVNHEVALGREAKTQKSSLFAKLKNKFRSDSTRALPNSDISQSDNSVMVDTSLFNISSMVNDEISESELSTEETQAIINSKRKESREDRVK